VFKVYHQIGIMRLETGNGMLKEKNKNFRDNRVYLSKNNKFYYKNYRLLLLIVFGNHILIFKKIIKTKERLIKSCFFFNFFCWVYSLKN
jgi:hypothetical protein